MIFKITCIPCEQEAQFNSVVNGRPSFSATTSGDYEQVFEQKNTLTCPFCEISFQKTSILDSLRQYLQTQNLSIEIYRGKVEFCSPEYKIILKREDIIEKDYFELFREIPNEYLSRNEFGLLKLLVSEINSQQWGISIQNI